MVIPRDTVTLENFERMEKGLPPIKEEKPIRVDPDLPEIPNRLEFAQIPDVSKIKRLFGWEAKTRVDQSLEQCIRFCFKL